MAIHPNSGVEFSAADPDGYPVDNGTPKAQRRKTVHVRNETGRAIALHLHETIADDGGGRPFQGRLLHELVTLKSGANAGIDKEFFNKWLEQNKGMGPVLLSLITHEDEQPESAKREE